MPARALLVILWSISAAWPLLWLVAAFLDRCLGAPVESVTAPVAETGAVLLARTLAWHAGIALVSVAIGWPVGAAMDRSISRGRSAPLVACLAIAILPPWLLFSAWWTLLSPGNALHDWFAANGHGAALRRMVLVIGGAGWGMAIAALVVAWWRRTMRRPDEVLDRLDGLRGGARLAMAWRRDGGGVLLAAAIVMAALGSDTVCFDLAQERSIGFELRSLEAQGAAPALILDRAVPAVLASAVIVAVAWWGASRARSGDAGGVGADARFAVVSSAARAGRAPGMARLGRSLAALAPALLLAALPLGAVAWRMIGERRPWDFAAVHGEGAVNALLVAAAAAVLGATVAVGHASLAASAARRGRGGAARTAEAILMVGWALPALLPSPVVGAAMAGAWGAPFGGILVDGPAAMVLGTLGRFGLLAALAGAAAGRAWTARFGELERLDPVPGRGPRPLSARIARWRAAAPRTLASALAGAMLVGALAAGDVAIAARLEPPGWEWIASSLLGAIHTQRPGAIMAAIVATALASLAAGWMVATVSRRFRARLGAGSAMVAALALVMLPACEHHDPEGSRPLQVARVIGGPGVTDGRFERPRAIAVDRRRDEIVVVDRTGRVQRFSSDGAFRSSFRMPEWELGMPVGVSIDDDGTLLVPDTHYHRVIAFDPTGAERFRFGHYGFEPGAFVYPTDILPLADGSLLVGEYGGADRLQVLTRDGRVLRTAGSPGAGPGAFERPQSLALSADGRELFVVDACNHRVQVLDAATLEVRRILGGAGSAPGRFSYPWAVSILPDGSLLVAEQGNSRLQRVEPTDGTCLGLFGGRGREPGRLDRPWAIDHDGRTLFVADTGSNRVLAVPLESIMSPPRPGRDGR